MALEWLGAYHRELLAGKYPQAGELELSTLVAETSLLLGDIADIESRHDEAVEYWRLGWSSMSETLGELSPRQMVVLIAAQQRLDKSESLTKMVAHLQAVGYRHPAFLVLLER